MTKKISEIEGIGPAFSAKLEKAGITTVEGLLEKGSTRAGRKAIASGSGLDEGKILDFVNMADLFRIKGIGSQFAELLKASGVDTVKELRNRNAANLHTKLMEVQARKKLTRVVPGETQLEEFIEQAKKLTPMVTY
jgi:predicted flap endonuclease-1-like 5' DNA nuclease